MRTHLTVRAQGGCRVIASDPACSAQHACRTCCSDRVRRRSCPPSVVVNIQPGTVIAAFESRSLLQLLVTRRAGNSTRRDASGFAPSETQTTQMQVVCFALSGASAQRHYSGIGLSAVRPACSTPFSARAQPQPNVLGFHPHRIAYPCRAGRMPRRWLEFGGSAALGGPAPRLVRRRFQGVFGAHGGSIVVPTPRRSSAKILQTDAKSTKRLRKTAQGYGMTAEGCKRLQEAPGGCTSLRKDGKPQKTAKDCK